MRRPAIAGALASLLALAGCGPVCSLHALFESDEALFEPDLVGVWTGEERVTAIFESEEESRYSITYSNEDLPFVRYHGTLGRLRGRLFLDLRLHDEDGERLLDKEGFVLLWPLHLFCRIDLADDTLRIAVLDYEWLATAISDGAIDIAHERVEGNILLTAPPRELQSLVERAPEEAFTELHVLRRLT